MNRKQALAASERRRLHEKLMLHSRKFASNPRYRAGALRALGAPESTIDTLHDSVRRGR